MAMMAESDNRLDADYARKSMARDGSEAGVDTQHLENEEFCGSIGISLDRRYTDNDRSAFQGAERPDYLRMMADIRAGVLRSITVWHANRLHRSSDEVNPFINACREHGVRVFSTTRRGEYDLDTAAGRKALRNDTVDAEYESEHRGERVAIARKRQARNGDYGGGIRAYGWGVDSGRVRSVCVNPKAPTMERVYEDRPVLDMTKHREDEAAEIRRWASDLLADVPMAQLLRDLARRGVLTVSQKDGRVLRRNGKVIQPKGWSRADHHGDTDASEDLRAFHLPG